MVNKNEVYVCEVCKSEVITVKNAGGTLVCCGKPMKKEEAFSVDVTNEKHTPVVENNDKSLNVKIGSVAHPMQDVHYIEWIAYVDELGEVQFKYLKPGIEAKATFVYKGAGVVYSYCNLHGLWKTIVK